MQIVRKALEQPLKIIAFDAGDEGSVVVEKVKALTWGMGYNAVTGESYVDMIAAGIVDPAKVATPSERSLHSFDGSDHRDPNLRNAQRREEGRWRPRPRLLIQSRSSTKRPSRKRGPFFMPMTGYHAIIFWHKLVPDSRNAVAAPFA